MLSTWSPPEVLHYQQLAKNLLGPNTPSAADEVLIVHLMTWELIETIVNSAKSITEIAEFAKYFEDGADGVNSYFRSVSLLQYAAFTGRSEVKRFVEDWKVNRDSFTDRPSADSLLYSSVVLQKTISELRRSRLPTIAKEINNIRAELKLPVVSFRDPFMEKAVAAILEKNALHGISDKTTLKAYRELLERGYGRDSVEAFSRQMSSALHMVVLVSFPVL